MMRCFQSLLSKCNLRQYTEASRGTIDDFLGGDDEDAAQNTIHSDSALGRGGSGLRGIKSGSSKVERCRLTPGLQS